MTNYLSPWHIQTHLTTFTRRSQESGYHGGLSLNVHAALLCEPYESVLACLHELVQIGIVNPFGCAITLCPIWYMKGISRNWKAYGGNSYGASRDGMHPFTSYTDVYNEAKQLAEKFPGMGFTRGGKPTVEELVQVRTKLGLPVILERQTEDSCLMCTFEREAPPTHATPPPEMDYLNNDEDDDDEPDYVEPPADYNEDNDDDRENRIREGF